MTRVCPFAERKMSAKQTKGFRFPEEKCHEVTKGDGRVTQSEAELLTERANLFYLNVSIILNPW